MAGISNDDITSITGAEIDFDIDWTQFEAFTYTDGSTQDFQSVNAITTASIWQTYTDETTGVLNKLVVGSIDNTANPALTLVDSVESTGLGITDRPSILELGSIYLKPIAGLETVDFGYSALVLTEEGSQSFGQQSIAMAIDTTLTSAMISTTNNQYLDNLEILYFKDGEYTGVSTKVVEGNIVIDQSVEFDSIQVSVESAHQGDLNIIDMYGVLDNIAQNIDTFAEHAADNNNDGTINIIDLYDVLNGIGQGSQSFDLVDELGNLVTSLDANADGLSNWTIVANGDVNMSGAFDGAYTIDPNIVDGVNAFQVSNAQAVWSDYDPIANVSIQNYATVSSTGSELVFDMGSDSLNLQNIINLVNNDGTSFESPTLSVALTGVPNEVNSGTGIVTLTLIDNEDGNAVFDQGAWSIDGSLNGDRKLSMDFDVEWASDGVNAQIALPDQIVSVDGWFSNGEQISVTLSGLGADIVSITNASMDQSATLDFDLGSLFDDLSFAATLIEEGDFYLTLGIEGVPVVDADNNTIISVGSEISIVDTSVYTTDTYTDSGSVTVDII